MAGQPRKRAMIAELERRAADFDGATVLEYACDRISSGLSISELAEDICDTIGQGDDYVTRHMLSKYLNGLEGGPEALAAARAEGAHGLAESGIKIVDTAADGTKEQIAGAKSQADFRLRMASHWNRTEYAPQGNANVSVQVNNFGQQHLDALRRRSVQGRVEAPSLPSGEPDHEVVQDG